MSGYIEQKYFEGKLVVANNRRFSICIYPPLILNYTEIEILYLLLQGKSLSSISKHRNRSVKTIWGQKKQLYEKLNIESDMTLYRDLILSGIVVIGHAILE
ncbi:TPA: helix-turn-helix transcriptional regulator [Escherichia coli]|uniref:Cyclic di-GMP phosphodiesterase YahA n=2 Tax=Escherichia coli TaxID=562 RepID=A0A1U9XF05_ECOLX|nr:LuxR C-terminal-related transcriptional regulator [Escherichia coli]EEZ5691255.1 helix-turn-helix transcriptional regulator [Escherichia coli O25]EEZ9765014.1 helix-turn-helix transcriptional regulator [Escherichia coli O115]AQZ20026.1 Cyclic di-GMP phosphodiesterase YahA [Escherichia coli]AYU70117.1 helix-turn-helix transcriptional regulator [Escherichia coli]EER3122069.1 helix-turn-helix transcriptional regulator [Escherichia coli]